jgi:hypothetical protein
MVESRCGAVAFRAGLSASRTRRASR